VSSDIADEHDPKTILVVEDGDVVREMIIAVLSAKNFVVLAAAETMR